MTLKEKMQDLREKEISEEAIQEAVEKIEDRFLRLQKLKPTDDVFAINVKFCRNRAIFEILDIDQFDDSESIKNIFFSDEILNDKNKESFLDMVYSELRKEGVEETHTGVNSRCWYINLQS